MSNIYLEKHGVKSALVSGVATAIKNASEDPLSDIIQSLQASIDDKKFTGSGNELKGSFMVIGCSQGVGLELIKLAKACGLITTERAARSRLN